MKPKQSLIHSYAKSRWPRAKHFIPFIAFALLALPSRAHASMFHGETLDSVAGAIAWFAFIIVPPVLIGVFLLVHILPEKVAEKRRHPQLGAIKCLCLLSLCFGGLLWPIAWLWAYSKPVLHKMAYGTDVDDSHGNLHGEKPATSELEQLRARVAELEAGIKGRESVMEIILLGIYGFFVWLIFFKFKWLPWNFTTQVITITLPIVGMMALFLLLNIAAPATDDVRAMNYVIPIVPRITGQVTEVPIQPNRPIKKGDVLFKIDPVPFEAAVRAAEATLRGANDQLNNAANKKAALTPRIDLAKKRVEQFTALAATGAGKRADLEQAQSDLGNLESEFLAADATESQARAQIAKSEADLINAKFDLEGCVHLAPANGRVANLALQPGVRATQFATMPVMSFIQEDDPWLLAFYRQNELRFVKPGEEAEIFMKVYPGRIIKCKVDSILWATAQGQLPISGNLPNTMPVSAPEQRIAVRLVADGKDKDVFLATGARGQGAIYTEEHQMIQLVRRVIVRITAKFDWFVIKHLSALFGGH